MLVILFTIVFPSLSRNAAAQTPQTGDVITVTTGDLAANATASGYVQAQESAGLTLQNGGLVAEVYVSIGDSVAAGAPLLQVDSAELERAVANAAAAIAIQEANLEALLAGPTLADQLAAEAAVLSAEANLAELLAGPDPLAITAAQANVAAARADLFSAQSRLGDMAAAADPATLTAAQIELDLAQKAATQAAEQHSTILVTEPNAFLGENKLSELEQSARTAAVQANAELLAAQEAYAELVNGDPNSIAAAQASVALAQANMTAAELQLAITMEGAGMVQIRQAEVTLAQAEESLHRLLNPISAAQIEIARAQLAQAQINMERAEMNLVDATLTAPFGGVITAVNISIGEQANGVLIEMINLGNLEVVLNVDEVDISQISIGQVAEITLETWPGQPIPADVVSIAPRNSVDGGGLVTYAVYLALGETDLPVRVDMTANASLVTVEKQDVLLVPNRAITPDRAAGKYYVTLADGDNQEQVEVSIGLRDEIIPKLPPDSAQEINC